LPWLPNGSDDPEVVLLKVVVEHADYWEHREWRPLGAAPAARDQAGERHQRG
jgi:general stress protein 26